MRHDGDPVQVTRGPARADVRAAARPAVRLAGACLVAFVAAGCVSERRKTVAILEEGALAPPAAQAALVGGDGGPAPVYRRPRSKGARRDAPPDGVRGGAGMDAARRAADATGGPDAGDREARPASAGASAVPDVGSRPEPRATSAATPAPAAIKTTAAPPAHEPVADVATLEQRRRETFLRCTTTIRAAKATMFVPPRYVAEAVVSQGRLTLRHLTIEAPQVKLVARTDGSDDISISARGDVSFHADRPASVIAESGLKTLLVRNDGYTPLR